MTRMTMVQALNLALTQEMANDDRVIVLGEDVGVDGGVFRVTDGLLEAYGEDRAPAAGRVLDTPLGEAGIVGMAIGMAVYGLRPVAEMQFSGFIYQAFHHIEQHASRMRWRSRGRFTVPMVIRAPYAAGVRALEHHSESREAYFAHTPGLKMVIPSGPRNARALLVAAIRDPDPVIFFEPKSIYRAFREEVPEEEEVLELGKSVIAREGKDLTMVSYGAMLRPTLEAAETLAAEDGVETEVIDLLTISPLDDTLFVESVRKTGRMMIVHEAHRSFGPGAEIASRVMEKSFWCLEAPIKRVTGFDTVVPLFVREQAYLPDAERVLRAARETMGV